MTKPGNTPRHDGWTEARRAAFLEQLALGQSVAAACRAVGKSARSAYTRRAAQPDFALAWAAAIEQGSTAIEQSALGRAVAGWLEPVTYRGRVIAHRERYDDRLLAKLLDRRHRAADRRERRAATTPPPDFSSANP